MTTRPTRPTDGFGDLTVAGRCKGRARDDGDLVERVLASLRSESGGLVKFAGSILVSYEAVGLEVPDA